MLPGSVVYSTASTFDARFSCVSITPLLFPVVPDVKIIVATSSAFGLPASASPSFAAALRAASDSSFSLEDSNSSSCSIQTFFILGHWAKITSKSPLPLGLKKRPSESERLIRSIKSSPGRPASRGTATVFPVIIPR